MFQSHRFTQFADRISQIMAVVYQGIAVVALLVIPFQAANWLKTPFIGAFVGPTMIFNSVRTAGSAETGTPYSRGIQPGDQLLQIEWEGYPHCVRYAAGIGFPQTRRGSLCHHPHISRIGSYQ